jgi:hypothetical protein
MRKLNMIRIPRNVDAELEAMKQRARKLKDRRTTQLGELVQSTGADTLPVEVLAGALLAIAQQSRRDPEAARKWSERGAAFFRDGARRGKASATDTATGRPS